MGSLPPLTESMTDEEYQIRLGKIRETIPSKPTIRRAKSSKVGDNPDFSYTIISDVISFLHLRGGPDYLFNEDQILEVLRREPTAQINYLGDYMWSVFLPRCYKPLKKRGRHKKQ